MEKHQPQGDLGGVELALAQGELPCLHEVEHEVAAREVFHHEEQLLLALNRESLYILLDDET